ncbi:hypothetical protein, partial [Lysobacter sp. A3-1-A15]|uniref:hypothetical protein n=1 Tax=Novilysobacter viscosus TaxID=3098602 RepID=UPI002EDB559D
CLWFLQRRMARSSLLRRQDRVMTLHLNARATDNARTPDRRAAERDCRTSPAGFPSSGNHVLATGR